MFPGDSTPSYSQDSTKSSLRALLCSRDLVPFNKKGTWSKFSDDSPVFNNIESPIDVAEFTRPPQNNTDIEINSPEGLDNQNDFNYSQKLFHISDGNLYSVFSPIQGRSYGMKPSFLRKQKYTVQECHNRGRKNLRKGLKFHNFLPSESVTSEKDNSYLKTNWRVHSECRLKEEHGTKQITISNWSQNVQGTSNGNGVHRSTTKTNKFSKGDTSKPNISLKLVRSYPAINDFSKKSIDPYDFSSQSITTFDNNTLTNHNLPASGMLTPIGRALVKPLKSAASSKKDSLNFVVNSLLDRPEVATSQTPPTCSTDALGSSHKYKHRRKPEQTRQVVPYKKYLSIMEESDSVPLDLSAKCDPEKCESPLSLTSPAETPNGQVKETTQTVNAMIPQTKSLSPFNRNSNFLISSPPSNSIFANAPTLGGLLQSQVAAPLMLLTPPLNNVNIRPTYLDPGTSQANNVNSKLNMALSAKQNKIRNYLPPNPGTPHSSAISSNMQYYHKAVVPQSRTRRRNQRSVIKQRLEDTFRQNGFLVKTKQVSDGEATFCKFRQLRKYTRYYLKSWQQHLPDEVNKMWKGFLPPKTVLPPAAGVSETSHESPQ